MDKELMCAICLEFFDTPLMLPCSHNFCKKCLQGIISSREQPSYVRGSTKRTLDCPLCQRSIEIRSGVEAFPVNLTLENVINVYKEEAEVSFNDASWSKDVDESAGPCQLHQERLEFYCLTCNHAVCKQCNCTSDKTSGASHRFRPIKEQMHSCQTTILSCLSEVKKKCIPLNDRIQLLNDILNGIQKNEESVVQKLEIEFDSLISLLKSQKEEVKRQLSNDFQEIKRPIEDQLRKHRALNTTAVDHQRKLSLVKGTKDPSLRIKLLQESERQLNSMLCFDLAWFSSNEMPTVNMPNWSVDVENAKQAISGISLQKSDVGGPVVQWKNQIIPVSAESAPFSHSSLPILTEEKKGMDTGKFLKKSKVKTIAMDMEKHPQKDDLPLYFGRMSISQGKQPSSLGAAAQRDSEENGITHKSSLSIHKHTPQSSQLTTQLLDKGVPQSSGAVNSMFVTTSSSSNSASPSPPQHTNLNVKIPQRTDFEIPSNASNGNQRRTSVPAVGMTISLRRNSEGGHQPQQGVDSNACTSVTTPTLPITTPITNSLLANLPNGSNIPMIMTATSVSSANEISTSAVPVPVNTCFGRPLVSNSGSGGVTSTSSFNIPPCENISFSQPVTNTNFNNANLPQITARDFSPSRGASSSGPARKMVKAKKIVGKR